MDEENEKTPCCEANTVGLSCSCSHNEGPGEKKAGRNTVKMIISLAVLLAVVIIVAIRMIDAGSDSGSLPYEPRVIVVENADE